MVQFLLFAAFASLQTNIRLYPLSAVIRTYLRLEKMAYLREVEMNYIFITHDVMVMTITETLY